MPPQRITVIGQGLAGTLLSFELWRRGKDFQVVESGSPRAASLAASGLFSAVTGQRTALMWRAKELLDAARDSYRAMERELGAPFFFEMPLLRIFTDKEQQDLYLKRAQEEGHRAYLGPWLEPAYFRNLGLSAPWGGMEVKHAGRLDVQGLLQAWRGWLDERRLIQKRDAPPEAYRGMVLDCRGLAALPDSPWIPFQPAKGESLQLRARGPAQGQAFYGRHFALPLGPGRWRLGATYDREDSSPAPTPARRAELEEGAKALFPGGFTVESQQAGLRPNVLGHFPVIGSRPGRPGHHLLNGLGSKGVLWAPWGARTLCAHLFEGAAIPPEVSSERLHAKAQEKSPAPAAG